MIFVRTAPEDTVGVIGLKMMVYMYIYIYDFVTNVLHNYDIILHNYDTVWKVSS